MTSKRKPYNDRNDIERLETNWERTCSLMKARQFSMAIVRSATCAEIATNIVIRAELIQQRKLKAPFVDSLLIWANGIQGKFQRILLPLLKGTARGKEFGALFTNVDRLNRERNRVVHGGWISDKKPAVELVSLAKEICNQIVEPYHRELKLLDFN